MTYQRRIKKVQGPFYLLQQLACQNVLVPFETLLSNAVISAMVCPLGQIPGLYVGVP